MRDIAVRAEHEYLVHVTNRFEDLLSFIPDGAVWVTTQRLVEILPIAFPAERTIIVPDGETQKSFATVTTLLSQISQKGLVRKSTVVAIGGGATTDLVGFAASIYMRGIRWIAVPTSLAGMVDASIGGKTGINLEAGKNLVGTFYSPDAVLVATDLLSTLAERDMNAGMAEVVKCGFIRDRAILDLVRRGYSSSLEELIFRAASVKAEVVSQDFKESDQREILNYGHTLGHAIERHSDYSLRHGEAIAIGLLFAAEVSHRLGTLSKRDLETHRELLSLLNLPIFYSKEAWSDLYFIMQRDKKRRGEGLRFVTLSGIGSPDRIDGLTEDQLAPIYRDVVAR